MRYLQTTFFTFALVLMGSISAYAQVQPCYGNPQAEYPLCQSDTVTLYSWAASCNTCVFNWSIYQNNGVVLIAGGGPSDPFATYYVPAPTSYPQTVGFAQISCYYTDTAGTFCTGPWTHDVWQFNIVGSQQMSNFQLLNGPYDGDTSKTWIYTREHAEYGANSVHWDYNPRTYSLQNGTLDSVIYHYDSWNYIHHDTLYIRWQNSANRQIDCGGYIYTYEGLFYPSWTFINGCNGFQEVLPSQPLNDAYPIGPDTLCTGDTAVYYTTPVPNATYTWTVSGGNILSGQGTDQVEVEWTSLPGSITVSRLLNSNTSSNTLNVLSPVIPSFSLGNDTTICAGTSITLTALSSASYNWSTSATTQSISISDSGSYWVSVPASYCGNTFNISDTILVDTILPQIPNLGPDQTICPDNSTLLDAGGGYLSYAWSTSGSNQTVNVTGTGAYSVTTSDLNGCTAADTINVSHFPVISPNLGPDTLVCPGDSFTFDAGAGFTSYLWPNGSTSQTFTAPPPGPVFVEVTDANACVTFDTVQLGSFVVSPTDLGNDTSFCVGNSIVLDPGSGFLSYTWSTGDVTPTITVSSPGPIAVATLDANNCEGYDSIFISNFPVIPVSLGADSFICADTFVVLDAGPDFNSYLWNTGDLSQTITAMSGMLYYVDAVDTNGCTATDSLNLTDLSDCVFPGDLDYDGVANNNDVLALGVAFGQVGPSRNNANLIWYGQRASDWSSNLPSGPNVKHCDSDGNGLANSDDTLAIAQNYGFTHNKTNGTNSTAPQLQIIADFDSVQSGDTAIYRVFLGDSLAPADSVYGLAFTVNYDTTLIDTNGLLFADYSNCWIASQGQLLTFTKDLYPIPKADLAVVRTSSADTNGYGELCRLGFVTIDNISGKKDLLAKTLHIDITDIRFINHEMMQLAITGSSDSTVVFQEELSSHGLDDEPLLTIYPTPAGDHFAFALRGEQAGEWHLRNLEGNVVLSGDAMQQRRAIVNTRNLANGLYFLHVQTQNQQHRVGKVPILR